MINNDEILQTIALDLASEEVISAQKLFDLVNSSENPQQLVQEWDAFLPGILHLFISRYDDIDDKDCLIAFLSLYSESINPNTVDNGESVLHSLAKNDLPELTTLLLSDQFEFAEKPHLYSVDGQGRTPDALAGVNTAPIFKQALKNDFPERVILVQSWAPNSIFNYLMDTNQFDILDVESPKNSVVNALALKDGLISNNGTIGGHLDFANNLYTNSFVDRPHTHWTWNSLCQANSGGEWEDAPIAVLEPLSSFANVEGVTPYDTTIMGPHRLSDKAIILVPQGDVQRITERLIQTGTFRGQIKGYDATTLSLREAVRAEISTSYPQAAKLLNSNGHDISAITIASNGYNAFANGYNHANGYFNAVSIEINGVTKPLMTGTSNVRLPAYSEYGNGKHIGMHNGSVSDIERDPVFIVLKNVSKDPSKISTNLANFIGKVGDKNVNNLCSVKAYSSYRALLAYDQSTGTHDFAEYLLKKAIIADFRAYHQQNNNPKPLDTDQLRTMVDNSYEALKDALSRVTVYSPDLTAYRAILQETHTKVLSPPKIVEQSLKFSIWSEQPSQLSSELAKDIEAEKAGSIENDGVVNPIDNGINV
ncbi:hypothetical protein BN59_02604 [Legionella massiliensis]|uniref:Uncharacterized protein n=1 Tax=Legionella massiliensis TaxID=1034943 RepID=A0A078L2G0_9GAMM|nr:hypothetical protein [Legionella massiliensis]CDZ78294.1 hypothetical protein BN59_02604 [Legionella massiliensis]CEE14032.1 hypothetical protein BN1094_02604 [Legionella massiliensis]